MNQLIASSWPDYELLDTGDGLRLERLGPYTLVRPDPNILWPKSAPEQVGWQEPNARYLGKQTESGWQTEDEQLLAGWPINWRGIQFLVKPTPFRHLGIFPEQSEHWQWLEEIIANKKGTSALRVLNLFAYTGGASLVAARAGAQVCHVDSSQSTVYWAKENAERSKLPADSIRWIVDDVLKFMAREVRRGKQYDLILMDPPVFGRGPKGEIWRLEEGIPKLAALSAQLLSPNAVGILVNFYATSLYPESIERVFKEKVPAGWQFEKGELLLEEKISKKLLPTGFFLRATPVIKPS